MNSKILEGIELSATHKSHENNWKYSTMRFNNQQQHDAEMYKDAAKRVVFWNCMEHCEIEPANLKNFNGKFYYTMNEERQCLHKCVNAKMMLHYGEDFARENNYFMDFNKMKEKYQKMEGWNPNQGVLSLYAHGYEESKVDQITNMLLQQTKQAQQGL